jgi:lipid II:glycine glycyltransferase (peptidoglycan interpeptide bridge formation enzyme)
MQPENNWLLNIEKSEEDLLAEMKQKGRYNLKIAKENGVYVTSSPKKGKELDAFYSQYKLTGKRHNISYRSKKYFEHLLEILGQKGYAKVYSVWIKKEDREIPLASAIIIFYNRACLYLYGGSGEEFRNLMAPYLLHWEIILEAKKQKLKEYNFLGVAPNEDPHHPWAGITRFKKQFGGYQVDILGSFDLPLKPFEYKMFKFAEKIRRK